MEKIIEKIASEVGEEISRKTVSSLGQVCRLVEIVNLFNSGTKEEMVSRCNKYLDSEHMAQDKVESQMVNWGYRTAQRIILASFGIESKMDESGRIVVVKEGHEVDNLVCARRLVPSFYIV